MAEVVGTVASAVTLAALFKLCIEAFDIIHTAQNQTLDLKKLTVRLAIEKCRLYTWGQAMGLTSIAEPTKQRPLDICPYPELVRGALELVLDMFKDSDKLKDKYGCISIKNLDAATLAIQGSQSGVLQQLSASFDNFRIKSAVRVRQTPLAKKTYWVIRDRKKFETLIHEAKALIDGLQDITKDLRSQAVQQEMMSSRIRKINDVRTLDWVSEVCEVDYPAFSDAASTKAETISEFSTFHRDIQNWKETVAPEDEDDDSDVSSVETTIAGLEDMTVTELKHKFSTYLLRAKERIRAKASWESSWAADETNTATTLPDKRQWGSPDHSTTEAEMKINCDILADMAEATADKDFKDELATRLLWFNALSKAERAAAFYKFGEHLAGDFELTRFFSLIQSYRLRTLSFPTSRGLVADQLSKDEDVPVTKPKPKNDHIESVSQPSMSVQTQQT